MLLTQYDLICACLYRAAGVLGLHVLQLIVSASLTPMA